MLNPVIREKRPTQRAPDWWDAPRFQAAFWAQAGSVKAALSRLTYQCVTQTVRHKITLFGEVGPVLA